MYECWTVVNVFVFLSCPVEGLQMKRQKKRQKKEDTSGQHTKLLVWAAHTSRMNSTLSRWQVSLSPSPKTLTIKSLFCIFFFFFFLNRLLWLYGMATVCMAFTAGFQVLCQSAPTSEFQGLIWSPNLKYIYIYKNTTQCKEMDTKHVWANTTFFVCVCVFAGNS